MMRRSRELLVILASLGAQEGCRRDRPADDMVEVPPGWYSAGCDRIAVAADIPDRLRTDADWGHLWSDADRRRLDECIQADPPRRVWVSKFEIDTLFVDLEHFDRCVDAGACERASATDRLSDQGRALVEYAEAEKYCAWVGKRLPTSAEWQKSLKGTDDRLHAWGDSGCKDDQGPDLDCVRHNTLHNGTWQSAYGLRDVHGPSPDWTLDQGVGIEARLSPMHPVIVQPIPGEYDSFALTIAPHDIEEKFDRPGLVDPMGPMTRDVKSPAWPRLRSGKAGHVTGFSPPEVAPGGALIGSFRCVRPGQRLAPPAVHQPVGEWVHPYYEPSYVQETPPLTAGGLH